MADIYRMIVNRASGETETYYFLPSGESVEYFKQCGPRLGDGLTNVTSSFRNGRPFLLMDKGTLTVGLVRSKTERADLEGELQRLNQPPTSG